MPYIPGYRIALRIAPLDVAAAALFCAYSGFQALDSLINPDPFRRYSLSTRTIDVTWHTFAFSASAYFLYSRIKNWKVTPAAATEPDPAVAPILPHIFSDEITRELATKTGPYDPFEYEYWPLVCEYLRKETDQRPCEILETLFEHFAKTCGSPLWPSRELLNCSLQSANKKAQAKIRWSIVEYFLRLTATEDYQHQPERMSALYTKLMFDICGEQPRQRTFKHFFVQAISGELENCSDRAAASFNVVHTRWRLIQEPDLNAKQELNELISIAKVLTLREGIAHVLSAYEREKEKKVEQSVHVHVFYEHALNDQLDLRSPTHFLLASDSFFELNPTETLLEYVEAHYFSKLQELERFQALISKCRVQRCWQAAEDAALDREDAGPDDFAAKEAMQKALLQTNLWQ